MRAVFPLRRGNAPEIAANQYDQKRRGIQGNTKSNASIILTEPEQRTDV